MSNEDANIAICLSNDEALVFFEWRMFISIATCFDFLLRKKLRRVFCNRVFYEVARLLDFRFA
jgi:hypothetical protein